MYYIYHIPGVKIGCSNNPKKRVEGQGYNNFEIIEEHTDINLASEREIQLQKEYGYKVDYIPYYKTIQSPNKEGRIRGGKTQGPIQGKYNVETGHLTSISADGGKIAGNKQYENGLGMFSLSKEERIKAGIKGMEISNSIQRTCPYCLKTIKGPNYGKWHGEKCKLKNKKI
jgi:hypothetical protein